MAIKTEWVTVVQAEQTFPAFLTLPSGPVRGGVLVIQEIFGVNSHIRSVAERAAEEGFVALAPDLFWRVKPHIELGYTPDDIAQGREVRGKLKDDETVQDVAAALKVLAARPEMKGKKLGVMGFCWGGLISYLSAVRLKPAAAAVYYGGGIPNYLKEADKLGPIMYHFGELDKGIPMDQVEQIKTAMQGRPDATVYTYPPADHGFHCDQRGSYHAPSAKQAWGRTMEFFHKHIG
jgi:carboxymethylenebutenolidase